MTALPTRLREQAARRKGVLDAIGDPEKRAMAAQDLADLREAAEALERRPIETAPQDGSRILLFRKEGVVCGWWNEDRYARRPRPYWSHDNERILGTTDARKCSPTHWMPLPTPPVTP